MDVFCTVTDQKNDISERVVVEEWVHGKDTFLVIAPDNTKHNIKLRVVGRYLMIDFVDHTGAVQEAVLNTFTGE